MGRSLNVVRLLQSDARSTTHISLQHGKGNIQYTNILEHQIGAWKVFARVPHLSQAKQPGP